MISTGAAMPARRKSFADIIREGLDRPATMSAHLSRSPSRNSFDNTLGSMGTNNPSSLELCNRVDSLVRNLKSGVSSFATAVGLSLSRSTIPEPLLLGSGHPPVGSGVEKE